MKFNLSEIFIITVLLLLVAIVGVYLYFGHPAEYVWLPSCPLRVLTGWLCPGCGTLRAAHHLLNGQLCLAFRCQPLFISLSPFLALLVCKMLYEKWRNSTLFFPFEVPIYWLIGIVIFLFFLLRNIPLDCFECLRPPEIVSSLGSVSLGQSFLGT
jgi:hypothetical protein